MKRTDYDHGATWSDYLDQKPGMFIDWKSAAKGFGMFLLLSSLMWAMMFVMGVL